MEQTNLRMKFKKMKIELIPERGELDGAKHLEKDTQRLIDRKRQKEPKGRQTKTEKEELL